jgi:membrane protease YdiL (CAAX protease family)
MAVSLKQYGKATRDLYTSLLLVIPLFVIYQVGVLFTDGVRNGVDFTTQLMFSAAGGNLWTYLYINIGILAAFIAALFLIDKRGRFRAGVIPWLLLESTLYAFALAPAIGMLMDLTGVTHVLAAGLESRGLIDAIVLSIGAGVHEELVFRLIMTGGLVWIGRSVFDWPTWLSGLTAIIVSSLIFSGIHYVGSLGDTFTMVSFIFRFFAGVLFAAIYYLRGFSVAVYTHALYDIFVFTIW